MEDFTIDPKAAIYIDVSGENVSTRAAEQMTDVLVSRQNLKLGASPTAINHAFNTVYGMAARLQATLTAMKTNDVEQPSAVEMEFGLRVSGELGKSYVVATDDATFTVKLVWKAPD